MRLVRDMVDAVVVVDGRWSGEGERSIGSSSRGEGKKRRGLGNLLDRHGDPQDSAVFAQTANVVCADARFGSDSGQLGCRLERDLPTFTALSARGG